MRVIWTAVLCLLSVCFAPNVLAEAKVALHFEKTNDAHEAVIRRQLEESGVLQEAVDLINESFRLPEKLRIIVGGDDGPLYDGATNEIMIPYAFVDEVKARFQADNYAETGVSVEDATDEALLHAVFHEIGHAFVVMYELPVLGKEEDAVDALATVLLIEYFDQGEEIALSAADLFALESTDVKRFTETDFWDEHSLDIQRYYQTLCLVYGSNPEQYASVKDDAKFSDDRAALCEQEYETTVEGWFSLLAPYQKAVPK